VLKISPKTINIITNHHNKVGMHRDRLLLNYVLKELGHKTTNVHYQGKTCPRADINIFVEPYEFTFPYFKKAKKNWVIANLECFHSGLEKFPDLLFLARTRHSYDVLNEKGLQVIYVGFYTTDFYDPHVKREKKFIHIMGQSPFKNTRAVLDAWQKLDYPLTLIGSIPIKTSRNVKTIQWVSDELMKKLQNNHLFHLCPSSYEGFGHYIHEAHGVGAVVISTDAPPMNELASALLIKPRIPEYNIHHPSDIIKAAHTCMAMSHNEIMKHSQQARDFFMPQRNQFKERMKTLLRHGH